MAPERLQAGLVFKLFIPSKVLKISKGYSSDQFDTNYPKPNVLQKNILSSYRGPSQGGPRNHLLAGLLKAQKTVAVFLQPLHNLKKLPISS